MKEKNKTNPHGANQTTSDPREQKCWDLYVKSVTEGRENAYQAAMDAGYAKSSALCITTTSWFAERKAHLRRREMVSKAESVLSKTMEYDPTNKDPIGKIDATLVRVQTDVAKFIASTQGKNDGYATRNELSGPNGAPIVPSSVAELTNEQLESILRNRSEKGTS